MSRYNNAESRIFKSVFDRHYRFFFLLPAIVLVMGLLAYPTVISIFYAFTNKHIIKDVTEWVGLDNFKAILTDVDFWGSIWVSIKYTVMSLVMQLIVGMMVALCLNRVSKFKRLFRVLVIIPWAYPTVIISFVWRWMFNGLYGIISSTLINIGLISQPIQFFSDANTALFNCALVNTWFGFPFMAISILAALQAIPVDQYEAARIDGAGQMQVFRNITLPHIMNVIGLVLILRFIWVFNSFDLLFMLTGGGPLGATRTLPIYSYEVGWTMMTLGKASAISVILLILLIIFSSFYFNRLEKDEGGV